MTIYPDRTPFLCSHSNGAFFHIQNWLWHTFWIRARLYLIRYTWIKGIQIKFLQTNEFKYSSQKIRVAPDIRQPDDLVPVWTFFSRFCYKGLVRIDRKQIIMFHTYSLKYNPEIYVLLHAPGIRQPDKLVTVWTFLNVFCYKGLLDGGSNIISMIQ